MAVRLGSRRTVNLLGLGALLLYAGWVGGPYIRSVIVRDAAVTTWISLAPSPIKGFVETQPLYPGQRVGPDGRIALIENPLADAAPLARAAAAVDAGNGMGLGGTGMELLSACAVRLTDGSLGRERATS